MKKVNSYFWKGLLAGIILLAALLKGQGQEIIDLDGHGKVSITYIIVSKKLNGIQIKNLSNQTFDIAEHGVNTKLGIDLEVLELDKDFSITLLDVCYKDTYYQFYRSNTPRRTMREGKKIRITYKYNASKKGSSSLALCFDLMKKGIQQKRYDSRGQKYNIINSRAASSSNTSVPEVSKTNGNFIINILERLEEAEINTKSTICKTEVMQLSTGQKATTQGLRVVELCKPFLTQTMTIEQEWEEALNEVQRKTKLHEQRKIVESFIRKHGAYKKANKTLSLIKAQEAALPKPPKPIPDNPKEKILRIARNFALSEPGERFDNGEIVEVTIRASGFEDMDVDLRVPNDINWTKISSGEFKLSIPKGWEGVVAGEVSGVSFVKNDRSRIKINTKNPPVTAKFDYKKDTDTYIISVKDGLPPYTLYIIAKQGNIISEVINIKGDTYKFKVADHSNIATGDYYLQVTDVTGAHRENAKISNAITLGSGWRSYIVAAAIIGLVLLIGIGLYLQSEKIKKKRKLSKKETVEKEKQVEKKKAGIAAKENESSNKDINPASQIQIGAQTSSSEGAKIVRPKITVKRKTKEPKTGGTAGHLNTSYPRLLKFESNTVVANLLIGPPSDYRRIDMLDVWKKSLVSEIYVRDIFIHRINRFVFEDNKALLDSRGENIPEIGGWILGRYHQSAGNNPSYTVVFERFIQLHRPADNSTTQITFGPNAWHDIDKAIDLYREEELELVGWFHTHPGWGVFLSGPDVNAHNTIFKKPYQIAMELESVKEPHDVGFFSRYEEDGVSQLNNRADEYHHWSDFSKWLKLS